jgi:hypothetical protein
MSDDIIYYNLTIDSNSTGLNNTSIASIIAQNSYPILNNPSEYYGSIIRMSTPQFEIPNSYFDAYVDPNTGLVPDVNQGVYQFTVQWGSITASGVITSIVSNTQYVRWIQQDFTASPIPQNNQPLTPSNYYYIYSYETIINLWNIALATAYAQIQPQVQNLVAGAPPFFTYDATTQLISLYSPQAYSEYTSNGGNFLQVFANGILEPYINGFKYFAFNDLVKRALFNIQSFPNQSTPINQVTLNNTVYLRMTQQFQSLAYMNTLRSIQVTTSMPVTQENFYVGQGTNVLGQNLLLSSILTDYIPDLSQGNQAGVASAQFIYNANSLYRIFCLTSNTPLYNFSCAIYWSDKNGNTWPLQIFTNQQISIKFMFIKKHLIANFLKSKV